jgi:hypothetical protein
MVEKGLAKRRPRKSVDNVGKSSEGHPDQTVSHERSIGDEDVEDVIDAVHAGPVDNLRSAKGLDIVAEGHEDEC